jgi:hypothetical protein
MHEGLQNGELCYRSQTSGHQHQHKKAGTSSINWAQLSRFQLKMETESSLRNVVF